MRESLPSCGHRISVVGTSGAGKTTLAREIARRAGIVHIELDSLYWEPNWTAAPEPVFRERVAEALKGHRWVVDGNYSHVRDIVWNRADTIVFLDYSFWTVFGRLLRRTWRRAVEREELWNGNRESVGLSFFSRESVLLWMLRTYRRNRKNYSALFRQPEYERLSVIRLRSPRAADEWLSGLGTLPESSDK